MQNGDQKERALNPTVIKLGLVSMFADISSEMLYPITPIFLTTVLGATMGGVGIVEGFAEATAALLKTYSGIWSDRSGRRKIFVVAGYSLAAISKPLLGSAGSWTQALLARGMDRAGKGLRGGPRDAVLAEAVSEKVRGEAFGWHRAMDTFGAAVGPALALIFLSVNGDNLRSIYYWALIPGLIAAGLTLTLREPKKASAKAVELWSWQRVPNSFRTYLMCWALFSIANFSDVFLLMRARDTGLSLKLTIVIYCFYNLVYSFASPYLGKLSDQVGRKPLLAGGFLAFAFVYAGFAFASEVWQYWVLFAIYGLYMAATEGVGKAFAIDLIAPDRKATAVGMLGTVTGICALVSSSAAGFFWDTMSPRVPFLAGAVVAVVAALCLSLVSTQNK